MTRSWWENEEIIRRFRDWLTQTATEIESLGDAPANAFPGTPGNGDPIPPEGATEQAEGALDLPAVGLPQLVEAFTAMRHELKLQTKGTRNLEAMVERSLEGLESASRTFQSVRANEREAAERAALPMIEALIALDEGLIRAAVAFQATHYQMTRSAPAELREELDGQFANQSWWRRFLTRRWHTQVVQAAVASLARSITEEFSSLMEGFVLIQSRLARALSDHGIRRLDTPGCRVDPTTMTVIELVTDTSMEPETVIDVVRPGYSWRDRVVRFAEVRAVASRAVQRDATQLTDDEHVVRAEAHEQVSD